MFKIIETKAGWAVQNVKTFHIVAVYRSQDEARRVCEKLNK